VRYVGTIMTANPKLTSLPTMPIIDCDIHQNDDVGSIRDRMPKAFRQPGWGMCGMDTPSPIGVARADAKPTEDKPAGSDPAFMLKHHFEPFGIQRGVLTGSGVLGCGVHPNFYYGSALATAYNEWVAEDWLAADERFFGAILVNPQDPAGAVREIEKWAGHPKFIQVIMTSASRLPYGRQPFWPIYEAAEAAGLPMSLHPGAETAGTANTFVSGPPSTYLEWHTNIPQNYMGHTVSLLTEGVFEKFPKLKFILVEGGLAWLPHVLWRLDKNWKALRTMTPWVKKLPSEYVWDHIRLTTQPIEEPEKPEHLEMIFDVIHAEKTLMFSSDYPHWDNDSPHHGLPRMSEELSHRVYHRNAEELYGWEPLADLQPGGTAATAAA